MAYFYQRYRRWSVIHRQTVPLPLYLGVAALYPSFLAALAVVLAPSASAVAAGAGVAAAEVVEAVAAGLALGRAAPVLRSCLALPLADVLLGTAWLEALFRRTIVWRGNRLRVGRGTRLSSARGVESAQSQFIG